MDYDNELLDKEIFPSLCENKKKENLSHSVTFKNTRKLSEDILDTGNKKTLDLQQKKKNNVIEDKKKDEDVMQKLTSLDSNLNKIQDNIVCDVKNQLNIFEEKKRNKMEKIKTCRGGIL